MIHNCLVLAHTLAISADSSNIGAGFDVDDDDVKAKVIASVNHFLGKRKNMLNNAFRDLSVSDQCIDETEVFDGSDFM